MIGQWLTRAAAAWYGLPDPDPIERIGADDPTDPPPLLRLGHPVHRPPRAPLPPHAPEEGRTLPCQCGQTWPDTDEGWTARDTHRATDRETCIEGRRARGRERYAAQQAIIRADPELRAQQLDYWREMNERRRIRERARSTAA